LVFVAAFAAQWVIGLIINLWPQTASAGYSTSRYKAGFALVITLQLAAAARYFLSPGGKTTGGKDID
jgi:hypothetical protein